MRRLLAIVLLTALSACSMSPPVAEKVKGVPVRTHRCVPMKTASCITTEHLDCEEHFADGCLTGATKRHECISRSGPPCTKTSGWECPEGFSDGCDTRASPHHICLPTNGGVSCDIELLLNCPTGFQDLCSVEEKKK